MFAQHFRTVLLKFLYWLTEQALLDKIIVGKNN